MLGTTEAQDTQKACIAGRVRPRPIAAAKYSLDGRPEASKEVHDPSDRRAPTGHDPRLEFLGEDDVSIEPISRSMWLGCTLCVCRTQESQLPVSSTAHVLSALLLDGAFACMITE